jgi:predicted SprT family Zn-dependent metalloprotease
MPLPKPDPGHGNRTNESPLLRRDAPRRVQLELVFAPPAPEKKPGRDRSLEALARELLIQQGAAALAAKVRVEWSGRLRSAAGRAEFAQARVLLNRRLAAHGEAEIDRTLRHELAHLLASARAGRRRLAPHGPEWRRACADLGIADELRCHNLPFPIRRLNRRYLYTCPHCRREFPRIRPLRRSSACLACCRAHHRGRYDERFKLRLVKR